MMNSLADAPSMQNAATGKISTHASSQSAYSVAIPFVQGVMRSLAASDKQGPVDRYHFQETWLSFSASLFPQGRHYTQSEEDIFDKAIKKHYSKK